MPLIFPTSLVPNTPEDTNDLNSILNAINTWANGNIDTDDILDNAIETAKIADANVTTAKLADGAVTDAKLASGNNSVYRTLMAQAARIASGGGAIAGTYILGTGLGSLPLKSGDDIIGTAPGFTPIYFDDADFTVAGKTQKLRVRAQVSANATAWSSVSATFGLYPVTFSGSAGALVATLGTVVPGSTVLLSNPGASGTAEGDSTDFTIPADGLYCLGVLTSAAITSNNASLLTAQLQTRNV